MKEYFDEVDKDDVPTGRKVTKQEAHDNWIIHRCVAVFVFDDQGRLYVQEHLKSDRHLDHTVGGHVASGEDYKTAAIREAEEEIGLTGVALKEIMTGYYSLERRYIHMFGIYECVAPADWKFVPNDEVDVIYPLPVEEIVRAMNERPEKFTGGFINTMKKYLEVNKLPHKVEVEL